MHPFIFGGFVELGVQWVEGVGVHLAETSGGGSGGQGGGGLRGRDQVRVVSYPGHGYREWKGALGKIPLVPRVKYLGDLPWMRGGEELLWGLPKLFDL